MTFEDGSREDVDCVVLCTGYRPHFPFLPFLPHDARNHPGCFYRRVFHPAYPTLAFVGFARPAIGAIPPTAELQARWAAAIAAGQCSLPPYEEMIASADRDAEENAREFPCAPQPTVIVHWIPYMDAMAADLGCRPSPWTLLLSPSLFWMVCSFLFFLF